MSRLLVGVLAAIVLGACSSGSERFCTLGLGIPRVEVDVGALTDAVEVCLGPAACAPVRAGVAQLRPPLIDNEMSEVELAVRDATGGLVAEAEVRLPRVYGNGFECGGDAPAGTVRFVSEDEAVVDEDLDGSGRTHAG